MPNFLLVDTCFSLRSHKSGPSSVIWQLKSGKDGALLDVPGIHAGVND